MKLLIFFYITFNNAMSYYGDGAAFVYV